MTLDELAKLFTQRTYLQGEVMKKKEFRESHAKQVSLAEQEIASLDQKIWSLEAKIKEGLKKIG